MLYLNIQESGRSIHIYSIKNFQLDITSLFLKLLYFHDIGIILIMINITLKFTISEPSTKEGNFPYISVISNQSSYLLCFCIKITLLLCD